MTAARSHGLALALVAATAAIASSCGWHAGLVAPDGIRTIGIEMFATDRAVLERGLETELSVALSRAVSDLVDTPLAAPSRAEAVITGRIVELRRRTGIRSTENALVESGLFVAISAELVDSSSGLVVRRLDPRHVWIGYALGPDVERHETEARARALRHVAETLVLDLFGSEASPAGPGSEDSGPEAVTAAHDSSNGTL